MENGITKLSVAGFKSIAEETTLDIKPLTLLAGANSSGKSSFMQPLLLLKQTLEAQYDPGPLLLNGANVKFTSFEQIFTFPENKSSKSGFSVMIGIGTTHAKLVFDKKMEKFHHNVIDGYIANVFREIESDNSGMFPRIIKRIIHIPGLRGNPQRVYQTTGTGPNFPGTFESYTASLIASWKGKGELKQLCRHLNILGLTSDISAKQLNDAQIEVMVGRLPKNGRSKADMVSIADVGFGVSQTLPVLVALLAAEPGQLVYLEQPEIHLHPQAQRAMAEILVDAANRGVKVVAETHSSMLLLAVQTLIAKQKIDPENVALHWFQRNKSGLTTVTTAELDTAGRFGDWPVDFGDVELDAESEYLDAVTSAERDQ
jgi:AAA15 family ATPase/GTPase